MLRPSIFILSRIARVEQPRLVERPRCEHRLGYLLSVRVEQKVAIGIVRGVNICGNGAYYPAVVKIAYAFCASGADAAGGIRERACLLVEYNDISAAYPYAVRVAVKRRNIMTAILGKGRAVYGNGGKRGVCQLAADLKRNDILCADSP